MPAARRLLLRLFLEGVEVPVIGARISISEGAPAAATIQIVPTDRALEFHARTMVHLFQLDIINSPVLEEDDPMGAMASQTGQTTDPLRNLEGYKLLFSGLYIGFQYMKQGTRRQLILQCLDFSIAWDTNYQYMLTYGPRGSGIMGSPARFIGANTNLFDDIINDPVSVVSGLLQSDPKFKDFKHLKGLLAGLVAVIEAVGGIPGSFRGVNDFNTVEELRNKLLHQVTTDEDDEGSINLFSRKAFDQWLSNSLGGMGGMMSIRDILNMVNKYIFYSTVPCPAAYFSPGGQLKTFEKSVVGSALSAAARDEIQEILAVIKDLRAQVAAAITAIGRVGESGFSELDVEAALPLDEIPRGDVSLSGQLIVTLTGGSPGVAGEDAVSFAIEVQRSIENVRRKIAAVLLNNPDVTSTSAYSDIRAADERLEQAVQAGQTVASPGSASPALTAMDTYLLGAEGWLERALGATVVNIEQEEFITSPRLNTQIFRPDVWFVAPPRCNVLFPDHYNSMVFNRQLLRECTRYQLRTSMELVGPSALTDWWYYAPDLAGYVDLSGGNYFTDTAIVMPHEVHSGIVPKMHGMGEISLYANKAQKAHTAGVAGSDKKLRSAFTQRVAHFHYFKFRFAPRVIQITGQLNPMPVCGFPMAIIDKPFVPPPGVGVDEILDAINEGTTEVTLATREGSQSFVLPTQFLGMLTSLEIAADQEGGHITCVLNYCRSHRTLSGNDDEYLNVRLTEKKLEAGNIATVTFLLSYDQLAENGNEQGLDVLRRITPQRISGARRYERMQRGFSDFPEAFEPAESLSPAAEEPKASTDGSGTVGGSLGVGGRGLQGTITAIGTNLDIREDSVGDRYYDQASVTETVEDLEGKLSTIMPPEEAIRPPWIPASYGNSNIGEKIYQPFFGTGSIVDEQIFQIPNRTPVDDDEGALAELGGIEGDLTQVGIGSGAESRVLVDPNNPISSLIVAIEATKDQRPISIAMALDALATIYGMATSSGMDVAKFVWRYVERPIATLPDMLGDRNFQLDETGKALSNAELSGMGPGETLGDIVDYIEAINTLGAPKEGFHSRSVADLSNLVGLLTDENGLPVDLTAEDQPKRVDSRGKRAAIAVTLDQRKERKSRVLRYVKELVPRALRG